jgi:hypothetical protein
MSAHLWSGAVYGGDVECGWYSGNGVYRFQNGTEYEGEFVKGHFHGRGVLRFPEGRLEGEFAFGRAVDVRFVYADGLAYEKVNWKYLSAHDRRFYREISDGIAPAGATALTNDFVAAEIPAETFDSGDGYFEPRTGEIRDYSGERVVRIPDADEAEWILTHCRQGGDLRRAKQINEKIAQVTIDRILDRMAPCLCCVFKVKCLDCCFCWWK